MKKNMHAATSARMTEVPVIAIGVVTAAFISVLLIAGLTSLIMNGMIGESSMDLYIFLIRTVAVAIGCFLAAMLMQGKYLVIAGATALGYLVILVAMGIVLYEGSFNNILSGVASTLLGGAVACITVLKPLKKPKHTARHRR